jgi:hypothetical protein
LWAPPIDEEIPLAVQQPKWWDELPLVPFLNICRFLDWKQVFGGLPKVCKHFKQLLTEEGQVGFDEISLENPSVVQLKKLKDKVSFCKSLSLTLYEELDEDTTTVLTALLDKFKSGVVKVTCQIQVESDQQVITLFLNECESLRFLYIYSGDEDWDWSLHPVCPTVRKLYFEHGSIEHEDITKIFFVFPALNSLSVLDDAYEIADSSSDNDKVVADTRNMAMIEHYTARNLSPSVQCLRAVKHMHLTCMSFKTLQKCTSDDAVTEFGQCLEQLITAFPTTLAEFKISSLSYGDYNKGNKYDLRIMKLLDELPASVRSIEYFYYTVRRVRRNLFQ